MVNFDTCMNVLEPIQPYRLRYKVCRARINHPNKSNIKNKLDRES